MRELPKILTVRESPMSCRTPLVLILLIPLAGLATAGPLAPAAVPEPLKPWSDWVLWHDRTQPCPALSGTPRDRQCAWPASLQLRLNARGGQFTLNIQTFAEQPVNLPGDATYWPQAVSSSGKALPVTNVDGQPVAWLAPGSYSITGRFDWDRLPTTLSIPPNLALIGLEVEGQPVTFPTLNEEGQLWISGDGSGAREGDASDALQLSVFRRLNDGVPLRIITHMDLDIAGKPREVTLPGALLEGSIPMQLDSGLPARVEPDGNLRLQARPGRWSLDLIARFPGDTTAIGLARNAAPWPNEEVWSFNADPAIRLAEVEGVAAIDPRQTAMPTDWQGLPAYRLAAGDTFRLRVIRRGDPQPEPDRLTLQRTIWLDFDGRGYTVNDRIGGQMTRDWRLNAGDDMTLGRVSIDNEPQPITRDETSGDIGVEVRRGALNLSSDSRLPGRRTLSATGWQKDFQAVSAELNLPPGWRLFSALGVDEAAGAWVASWTLLDFFVVLTLTLAVGRLWDWRAGAFTLVTLALLWQEPGAPCYVWLNLLAATALLRVLPEGKSGEPKTSNRARQWVRTYRLFSVLLLALVAIPFIAQQLRLGLYPQLEQPRNPVPIMADRALVQSALESESATNAAVAEMADALEPPGPGESPRKRPARPPAAPMAAPPAKVNETDPNAITQTGPGLPRWEWQRLPLLWKGPVQRTQELTLILIPPAINLLLNILRVILLMGLAGLLIAGGDWKPWGRLKPQAGTALVLALLVVFTPRTEAAEFPTQELLNELRARLLAPADCQPNCAEIQRLSVKTGPDSLRLELDIDAVVASGIPLPAQLGLWLPSRVEIDGQPAPALIRTGNGQLWLAATPGHHQVTLTGALPAREQIELPLPLKPHRVEALGTGWRVEGIGEHGVPDVQLKLVRESTGDEILKPLADEGRPLPAFMAVERTLKLGLEWRVASVVRRLTPPDSPVSLEIPVLPGESVLTAEVPVREGKVVISLPTGQTETRWESTLTRQPQLTLTAPQAGNWTELWRLDASPAWHVTSEGIAVVHHQNPVGRWQPEWRPWAGETVTLSIGRPAGAPGTTLTLDASDLTLRPGERATESALSLNLRSSQGSQQQVTLPPDAILQTVTLDGVLQPIRQEGRSVMLPVHPGSQTAVLKWLQDTRIGWLLRGPEVSFGASSVNASTHIELNRDRWVLLVGGPRLGPAVLFWSLLATLALVAYGLARVPGSPAGFWQWSLLLIGLSQASLPGGTLVVGWLLALAWRGKYGAALSDHAFKAVQVGLALLTLASLAILANAVASGLLGLPAMQIAGHGSDAYHLNWYQDRTAASLPRPWVVSVPLWVYRVLMLAWALWLANTLLNWLQWGWSCCISGRLWRRHATSS